MFAANDGRKAGGVCVLASSPGFPPTCGKSKEEGSLVDFVTCT